MHSLLPNRIKYSTFLLALASFSACRTIFYALRLPIEIGREDEQVLRRQDNFLMTTATVAEELYATNNLKIPVNVQDEMHRHSESRGITTIASDKSEVHPNDDDDDYDRQSRTSRSSRNGVRNKNNGIVVILGMYSSGNHIISNLLEKVLVFRTGGENNFENGELVHARWNGLGHFYSGMIIGKRDNETFDILYEDADYELAVPKKLIRSKDISRLDPTEIIRKQNDIFLHQQNISWDSLLLDTFDPQRALNSWNASDKSTTACGKLALKMLQNHGTFASTPWLMNDPLLSITWPTWSSILKPSPTTTSAIVVYRNPLDVALVLQNTRNIPLQKGLILWMKYNKNAIENSMGLCRIPISYDDLVERPLAQIQSIAQTLHDLCGFTQFHPTIMTQEYIQGMQLNDEWIPSHHGQGVNNNYVTQQHTSGKDAVPSTKTCQTVPYAQEKFGNRSTYNQYLETMKVYCDLINKRAFQDGYIWPKLDIDHDAKISTTANNYNLTKRELVISENMCKVIHRQEQTWSCSLQSQSQQKHSLARFVIFQRDLGHKLQDLIAHYHSAVPFDSLVIIDHNGSDKVTSNLLQQYSQLGAHIWKCRGSFDQKAIMWSHVAKFYANASDFVFPLDGDEYMTILHQSSDDDDESFSLRWNHEVLQKELSRLEDNGLTFKTIRSNPFPIDCELNDDQTPITTNSHHQHHQTNVISRSSSQCRLKYTVSDIGHYCYNKIFYRGHDLTGITHGNHNPPNHVGPACREKYKFNKDLENSSPIQSSDGLYNLSNFTIIHMQSIEFSDFILHRLRGASDKEFNKITKAKKGACNPYGSSGHYCDGWLELVDVSFDFYKMKDIYKKTKCKWDPTKTMVLPLDETFGPSCQPEHYKAARRISVFEWMRNMFRISSS